jgi:hypothetical protein
MRKYKSIEKIKAKIISHREKLEDTEKKKSVSRKPKRQSSDQVPSKHSAKNENSLMLKTIVEL